MDTVEKRGWVGIEGRNVRTSRNLSTGQGRPGIVGVVRQSVGSQGGYVAFPKRNVDLGAFERRDGEKVGYAWHRLYLEPRDPSQDER